MKFIKSGKSNQNYWFKNNSNKTLAQSSFKTCGNREKQTKLTTLKPKPPALLCDRILEKILQEIRVRAKDWEQITQVLTPIQELVCLDTESFHQVEMAAYLPLPTSGHFPVLGEGKLVGSPASLPSVSTRYADRNSQVTGLVMARRLLQCND